MPKPKSNPITDPKLLRAALDSFAARISRIVDEHLSKVPSRKIA